MKASEIEAVLRKVQAYGTACFNAGSTMAGNLSDDNANDEAASKRLNSWLEVSAELAKHLKV